MLLVLPLQPSDGEPYVRRNDEQRPQGEEEPFWNNVSKRCHDVEEEEQQPRFAKSCAYCLLIGIMLPPVLLLFVPR
jgi:hypothetical protein